MPHPFQFYTSDRYFNKKMEEIIHPKIKLKDCIGYETDPTILNNLQMILDAEQDLNSLKKVFWQNSI